MTERCEKCGRPIATKRGAGRDQCTDAPGIGTEFDAFECVIFAAGRRAGMREAIEASAFECEDRARMNEGSAMKSDADGCRGDAAWYRARAGVLRSIAAQIRALRPEGER